MNEGKLSKNQVQKLALSSLGFVVLLYVYFSFFLGPLSKGRATSEKTIADLQAKLASTQSELAKTAKLEKEASAATARFSAMKALSSDGAPIAWFPPRMKLFFSNQEIEKVSVRMDTTTPFKEAELADWSRYTWTLDLPQTDFATVGKAIAELENAEPLLAIQRVSVKAAPDTPQFQQVTLTAAATTFKR
ncbi:MAG: hypothetical protein M3Y80_11630 [Verrucomicrobiota bacterium]|nr:hypothetical protein [Verrucomicrobiota bacterium]